MDYTNADEKLAKVENKLMREKRHIELLSRLGSTEYKLMNRVPEKVSMTLKTEEQLSKSNKLVLPLKVTGRMLGIGRHKLKYYTAEELKKAVKTHQGKVIPIKLDHRRNEAGATIGAIERIYWDDETQAIKYEGHINDETHARNIIDRVVKEVSASIESATAMSVLHGVVGTDLEFPEVSVVEEGAYQGNSLEAIV